MDKSNILFGPATITQGVNLSSRPFIQKYAYKVMGCVPQQICVNEYISTNVACKLAMVKTLIAMTYVCLNLF